MADILISASAQDKETAEFLSRLFEARKLSVDWMPLDPAEPGNKSGIVRRRANARVTIALWSQHSVNDAQVLEDAREALRRGSLLTARLEDIAPPPEFRASPIANLTGWDGSDSDIQAGRLLTQTAKLMEQTSTRPALALASARLNRSARGPSGGGAAALRPNAYPSAAPVWPDAIARAGAVAAASEALELKSATANAADAPRPHPDASPVPVSVQTAETAAAPTAAPSSSNDAQPASSLWQPAPRPEPETAAKTAASAPDLLTLTPASVKTAGDVAEAKLEPQPAPVMFAGAPANDALPLQPANVTINEAAPAEPTYQTFTFEPEPIAEPQSEPEPAPVIATPSEARVLAPAPAVAKATRETPKAPAPQPAAKPRSPAGKNFFREARERTERDDRNHYLAILLGIVASIALLAFWLEQRPQDFVAPAIQKTPAVSLLVQRADAPILEPSVAPAAADAPATIPANPQIAITSDLPLIEPAPSAPLGEPIAAPAHAIDTPDAPPAFALAPAVTPSPPPVEAAAPAPRLKAKAPAFAEAPAVRTPAPAKAKSAASIDAKAKRLAAVGRALDARATASAQSIPSKTIAALAGAAPSTPSATAQSVDPLDPTPSQTMLRLGQSDPAFRLPGLAPTMLGAWTPGPDAPAPQLNAPIADAEWNAAPARMLAQSALSIGSYKDHLINARAGDRRAMLILGLMRQTGIGEARDDARAFAWLRRAALAGEPRALAEIGAYYALGLAATRDDERAARNFDRSASLGAAAGKTATGWALAMGRGLSADPAAARAAFANSAKAGDPLGMLNLGRMQADGLGGAMDVAAATASYGKAADQGFAPAQYALGVLLLLDRPAPTDDASAAARTHAETLAALRVQQAAAQGYPPAQTLLGALYLHGIGVAPDNSMARAWLSRAPRS